MIFVTLGTQNLSFKRALDYLENSDIADEIIVQAGCTQYSSKKMKIYQYIDKNEFDEYIKKADYVICHCGVGSIISSLKLNKKILAIPRLARFNEHHNDHQLEIAKVYEEKGYVLVMHENDDFNSKFEELKKFKPNKFISNNDNFVNKLREYILNEK